MHKKWMVCGALAVAISGAAAAKDIRDQWDVKISKAELVFPNAQPQAVARSGQLGFVEDLDADGIAMVDQRREADQRGAALLDFHQLGQLAKAPVLVARIMRLGRLARRSLIIFRSCFRLPTITFRYF